tara:strand:- start:594 stop:1649 length:1056 start_codon:yes stop_codon:yes gene_type:complete
MSYNSVGRPKFYIDAVMLARQLGHLDYSGNHNEGSNRFFLNPVNTRNIELGTDPAPDYLFHRQFNHIRFKNTGSNLYGRRYLNSINYFFILGHRLATDNLITEVFIVSDINPAEIRDYLFQGSIASDGWFKHEKDLDKSLDVNRFTVHFRGIGNNGVFSDVTSTPIGDFSAGWSFLMPQSPNLELTQTFSNESLKVQTTKGGATLTNKGWNQPPKWGVYPQWKASPNDVAYPTRRSWNLKFSFISDTKLMPQFFNELDSNGNNRGIFERFSEFIDDNPINPRTDTLQSFRIKDDFLTKVVSGTNNFMLPFIFQPDHNVEEYAICRVNQDSVVFTQVAHRVYDVSLNIIEVW